MARIALIRSGAVENVIEAELAQAEAMGYDEAIVTDIGSPGDAWDGAQFIKPTPPPTPPTPPTPEPPRIITRIALATRMTDAEYVGILTAGKTDIAVQAWQEKFSMVSQIDLDDPRTAAGMGLLASKALLTEARVAEILSALVQPAERP